MTDQSDDEGEIKLPESGTFSSNWDGLQQQSEI
jgi:hypothetical protein